MTDLNYNFKMEGYYSFKVTNSETGAVRDVSHIIAKDHKNLILNSGLNSIGTGSVCGGCKVGTGSAAVTVDQVDLVSSIASTTTVQAETVGRLASPPYYVWGRRTFRFNQGVATGNLTEVGTHGSSSTNLFSRALIVDSNGVPTTLTILSDEWLDVTYELRIYQDLADKTFNVTLLGTDHVVTVRPSQVTGNIVSNINYLFNHMLYFVSGQAQTYNGSIGSITGSPSATASQGINTISYSNYTNGSFERTIILSAGLNESNLNGGISVFEVRTHKAYWQLGFAPAISKDSFRTLVINITTSWGRYDPE